MKAGGICIQETVRSPRCWNTRGEGGEECPGVRKMRNNGRSETSDSLLLDGPRKKQEEKWRQPQEARTSPWLIARGDLSPDSAKNGMGQQQEEAWKLILLQKLQ